MNRLSLLIVVSFLMSVNFMANAIKLPAPQVINGINYQTVIDYCDSNPIDNLEGLWSFPDDQVLLFIKKNSQNDNRTANCQYSIIVVEAEDQYLLPGQVIGYLSITPESNTFRMWLYTEIAFSIPAKPQECIAKLIEDSYGLTFRKKEYRVKINPLGILPNFWRIIKVQSTDPTLNKTKGFIKIYPSYDGNGSSYSTPRYL